MSKKQSCRFLHLRDASNVPYATLAFRAEANDVITVSFARRTKGDNFSYAAGRGIAEGRLNTNSAERYRTYVVVDPGVEMSLKDVENLVRSEAIKQWPVLKGPAK